MRMRFAIWKIEARLTGMVLMEALPLTLALVFLAAELGAVCVYLFVVPLAIVFKLWCTAAAIAFALVLYRNLWSVLEDSRDQPLREPLGAWPELESAVRDLARELRRPVPKAAAFLLSPVVWRRFGCAPARLQSRGEISIPISCLGVWPVLSLRCHVGHALVRRQPRGWLFYAVRKSLTRLAVESREAAARRLRPIKPQRLIRAYLILLMHWDGLANMQADARIAPVLGASAVATWICQTQLAGQVATQCLRRIIQPAAERGVLLPIAASCAAFYSLMEPGWLAVVEGDRVKAQRSKAANPFLGTLMLRLRVLTGSPASVYDPRPAASLLPTLDSLEEKLLRHEAALGRRRLRRAAMDEIADAVLLPMMREEVERNAAALKDRTAADVPDLLQDAPALAAAYLPDPRYLLAPQQRKALVPGLLSAFLTLELERRGWRAGYTVPPGLIVEKDGRTLCPNQLISALNKGGMSREAFLKLLDLDPS
ncbi:MAG: hypothetical protein ABSG56_37580 [Bryobacteraceae bacterium]